MKKRKKKMWVWMHKTFEYLNDANEEARKENILFDSLADYWDRERAFVVCVKVPFFLAPFYQKKGYVKS